MGKPLGLSSLVPFSTDDIQLGLHEWTGASRKFDYIQVISIGEFGGDFHGAPIKMTWIYLNLRGELVHLCSYS